MLFLYSRFCALHSTEIALLGVINDLLKFSDSRDSSIMVHLKLSASFNEDVIPYT